MKKTLEQKENLENTYKKVKLNYYQKRYYVLINIIFILLLAIFYKFIKEIEYNLKIIQVLISLLIIFLIVMSIIMLNYNIIFDFEKEKIIYLEPGKFIKKEIKMSDIKKIKIKELNLKKKKECFKFLDFNFSSIDAIFKKNYVYNNGKVYMFIFEKKDGNQEFIEYSSYYDCSSIECIKDFEVELNSILLFLNKYLNDKKIK